MRAVRKTMRRAERSRPVRSRHARGDWADRPRSCALRAQSSRAPARRRGRRASSAFSISCSTSSTAVPASRNCAAAASTRSTSTGERPADGSSSIKRRGSAHQALRHRQHLLLAARQGHGAVVALLGDLRKERQRLLDARRELGALHAVTRQHDVVVHAELGEDAMALDHVHQSGIHRLARAGLAHVLAAEGDRAGARQQAGDRLQERALAGAVGAEQGHDLAGADREVDAVQHADLAVAGRQAADLEQRFDHRVRRRGRH